MEYKDSLASAVSSPEEAMRIIADNMLKIRPRADVSYRPYRKTSVYYDKHLDLRIIDLKKLYPQARPGNAVYVSTVIEACVETDAKINFIGNAAVIYGDKVIFDSKTDADPDGKCRCALHLKKGDNPVLFLVRCDSEESFEFRFMPSVRWYWIWAKCYLLSARATSPIPCYKGEDGVAVSPLLENESVPFDGNFAYPVPQIFDNTIDFSQVFPEERGRFGYALTYAVSDTVLDIETDCEYLLTVNGAESDFPVALKRGDSVLIRLSRGADGFAFRYNSDGIGIPFMNSSRESGDRWLTLASFIGEAGELSPENEIQFEKPYVGADGHTVFWKLSGKDDYLRPYLSSRFFGQWHYTFMVGEYGLLNASRILGEPEYERYFCDHMSLMVRFFDYMRYEHRHFSSPSFLDISSTLHDLDSIGSIGRNLCEYYFLSGDRAAIFVIDTLLDAVKTNIPRFEDGTFHRERDMWADDTFMSCPFLTRAGILKNDREYHREVVRQLLGFRRRLWMEDERVFSHIFFLDTEKPNRIPWGRGNGWVFVSMSDALERMSPDTEGYDELLSAYREFAFGIAALQDGDGLWHQVLNRHDSYAETSCTAMFIIGFCRGLRNGWLPSSFEARVNAAYNGLLSHKIDRNGAVFDVCMGSGNSTDVNYYMQLGAIDNDDHGTGVILTALSEIVRTRKADN